MRSRILIVTAAALVAGTTAYAVAGASSGPDLEAVLTAADEAPAAEAALVEADGVLTSGTSDAGATTTAPSTAPPTTVPTATAPSTTVPTTTAPVVTTAPPMTAPPTTAPPSTAPPTTAPASTVPPTTAPPTTAPRLSVVAAPGLADDFAARINGLRASAGVPALTRSLDLDTLAAAWARHLAESGVLAHSTTIQDLVGNGWHTAGENVGYGPDVAAIFGGLVASAPHHDNMVNAAFTSVGVGVYIDADGVVWTAHLFAG